MEQARTTWVSVVTCFGDENPKFSLVFSGPAGGEGAAGQKARPVGPASAMDVRSELGW